MLPLSPLRADDDDDDTNERAAAEAASLEEIGPSSLSSWLAAGRRSHVRGEEDTSNWALAGGGAAGVARDADDTAARQSSRACRAAGGHSRRTTCRLVRRARRVANAVVSGGCVVRTRVRRRYHTSLQE